MKKLIVTISGIVFVGACCAFSKLWSGMFYFALLGIIALSSFWAIVLILNYKNYFIDSFEDNFKFYIAKMINTSNLSVSDVEKRKKFYEKKFKKSQRIDKIKSIAIISVLWVVVIICFALIIKGGF